MALRAHTPNVCPLEADIHIFFIISPGGVLFLVLQQHFIFIELLFILGNIYNGS